MKTPEISIIMSCFNAEETVQRAVQSMLGQSFHNFEFVIVDDGSKDKTRELLNGFVKQDSRIKLIFNKENIGLAGSLNKAILAAKSDLIARMDADDEAYNNRLEIQFQYLNDHREIDILGTAIMARTSDGQLKGIKRLPENHSDILQRLFKGPLVYHPTILIRKEVFLNHGMYDPNVLWAEDADLWYRVYDKVKFHNLNNCLLYYTVKNRLSLHHARKNLSIKIINLKRRKKLIKFIPQLVKDVAVITKKLVKY